MKTYIYQLFLLLPLLCFTQNYNISKTSGQGLWNSCSTWNYPIEIYNTINDYKVVNAGVTITQTQPIVYAKKVVLSGPNAKVILNPNTKISFIGNNITSIANCNSNNSDNIIVNFEEGIINKPLTGFLHGIDPNTAISSNVSELEPTSWRVRDTTFYQKAYDLATRVTLVLSDTYTYGYPNWNPNWIAPNLDPLNYINSLATKFQWGSSKPGLVWECWNEPNLSTYWAGSQNDFFETYKLFYNTLRENLGSNALAAGPSLSTFNATYMEAFFDYCLYNDLEVNAITWHELQPANTGSYSQLVNNVQYVRDKFFNNPKYNRLNFKTIEVNEIVAEIDKDNPVAAISHLGYLEKVGVDYTCKSCWEETINGIYQNSCESTMLNNLFTYDGKTTSNWWAYKLYSNGANGRVRSYNENPKGIVIASAPTQDSANILLGYSDTLSGNIKIELNNIDIVFPGTNTTTNLYLNVKKIPNQGPNTELAKPLPYVQNQVVHYDVNGNIVLNLTFTKDDVYEIQITKNLVPWR